MNTAAVNQRLGELTTRIDGLSLRERALLLVAVLVVPYVLWQNVLMAPLENQQRLEQGQVAQLNDQITALDQQARATIARNRQDPDQANRARRAALQTELDRLNHQLKAYTANLIPPPEMGRVLERMLAQEKGLRLIGVQSLPAKPLLAQPDAKGKAPAKGKTPGQQALGGIYKRGVRIEFEGTYPATMRYLRALESLPWQLFWDGLDYQVQKYPHARVTITVHTLSLQEGWIGV